MAAPVVDVDRILKRYDWPTALNDAQIHSGLNEVYRIDLADTSLFLRITPPGWRGKTDIAVFLWGQTCSTQSRRKLTRRLNAFLRGYEEVRPLSDDERNSIPALLAIRHIWFMGLMNRLARREGKEAINEGFFTGCLAFLKNWLAWNDLKE